LDHIPLGRRVRERPAWNCVSLTNGARDAPEEFIKDLQVVITGAKYASKRGGKNVSESIYKLDPTKRPKTIDVTFVQGPNKGKTQQGIYSLAGDTLTICGAEPGSERPTEFASRFGRSYILMVLERGKP
jgi:uncharacterized protein (TIGR03067 family)